MSDSSKKSANSQHLKPFDNIQLHSQLEELHSLVHVLGTTIHHKTPNSPESNIASLIESRLCDLVERYDHLAEQDHIAFKKEFDARQGAES